MPRVLALISRVPGVLVFISLVGALIGGQAAGNVAASGPQAAHPALRGTEVFSRGVHRAPSFDLRDQNGRRVTVSSLRGRIFAVTFMDSHCRQECPVEGRELAIVQRSLGSRSPLVVIVVTVNPGDSPSSARAFAHEVGLTGEWHWLFGTKRALEPIWQAYGIQVKPTKGDVSHTSAVYLIDQAGWIRVADAVPLIPAQLVESVRALASRR